MSKDFSYKEKISNLEKDYIDNLNNSKKYIFENLELNAYCFKVIDGDTIKCLIKINDIIDTSRNNEPQYLKINVRLNGIDTAEKRSNQAREKELSLQATNFTKKVLENKMVFLKFLGLDKYGRHLCKVYKTSYASSNLEISAGCISEELLKNNLANTYDGKKKAKFV